MKEFVFLFSLVNFFRETEFKKKIQQEIYKIPSNRREHRQTLQKKFNKNLNIKIPSNRREHRRRPIFIGNMKFYV